MTPHRKHPTRIATPLQITAAATLIVLVIGASLLGRAHPSGLAPEAQVAASRLLRFADRADHAVVITDATTGGTVAVVTGPSGFLRATMSGLARIRETNGFGRVAPFKLTLYRDHRLTLSDPVTAETIELEAFGPTNEAVFARLLNTPPGLAIASAGP